MIKAPIILPYGESSKLLVSTGLAGATGNYYCGLHEFEDMAFMLKFLRAEDVFADIGANIGSYSILASKELGAQVHAFEPIPSTFKILVQNIKLNDIEENVFAHNIGVGSKTGKLEFTSDHDTINHVATSSNQNNIEVEVRALDDCEFEEIPALIKIDVEGFETEVINGMRRALKNERLKAIIIELNGSGGRYGYSEDAIHEDLCNQGFSPYKFDPFNLSITPLEERGNLNTLYLRDLEFIRNRLSTSRAFKVNGVEF